jgi:hypothetical protein
MPAAGGKPRADGRQPRMGWQLTPAPLRDSRAAGGSRVQCRDRPRSGCHSWRPGIDQPHDRLPWDLAVSRDRLQVAVAEENGRPQLTRLPLAPGRGRGRSRRTTSTGRVTDSYPSVSPTAVAWPTSATSWPRRNLISTWRAAPRAPATTRRRSRTARPVWMPDGRRLVARRLLEANVGSY